MVRRSGAAMNDVVLTNPTMLPTGVANPYLPKQPELQNLQDQQLQAFLQRGFPTRREEHWKYTDTSFLGKQEWQWAHNKTLVSGVPAVSRIRFVFVNGYFSQELSDIKLLPDNVVLTSFTQKISQNNMEFITEFDAQKYPFAALNTALTTDGFYLCVPANTVISEPIHCLFVSSEQNHFITSPRNMIILGRNSQATLIEEYYSNDTISYFTNSVTQVFAEENAQLQHYKIQAESENATHVATFLVNQKQDSCINRFCLDVGSRLAREDVVISLAEAGAACHLRGFYKLTEDKQHVDNHLLVDHLAANGNSSMAYKGTIDKKARAVFNGKVYVHPNAQKITALQSNHNLLLSTDAEVDTKPELEIYADDVKCSHGATVGQLNSDALFYLQARGISKEDAALLLIHAFADDIMKQISQPQIKQYIQQRAGHYAE